MKTFLISCFIFLTASTVFARARGILVEVVSQKDAPPTVSIYSDSKSEQRVDVSVAEAAKVLEQATQGGGMLGVSILMQQFISKKDVWMLLDSLKSNDGASLDYLEAAVRIDSSDARTAYWSEKGKQLLAAYKKPENTKSKLP